MALNGLQIHKLLPQTNCKECGSNTCLAFAMKLAAKKANLSECPYASEEAKTVLGADSEPPVKTLTLGSEKSAAVGGETVLYRHEKTFVHQTLLAVGVNDDDPEALKVLERAAAYRLERVGEILTVNAVAVTQRGSDDAAFVTLAKKAWETTGLPVILRSANIKALKEAAEALRGAAR